MPKGAKGLSFPDMPIGYPGMGNGTQKRAFVCAFNQNGQVFEYQTYPKSDK